MAVPMAEQTNETIPVTKRPSSRFQWVFWLLAAIGLAVGGWLVYRGVADDTEVNTVPDFTLPLLTEESPADFTLSEYRGQVVLVNVWGSWCVPCQEEAPMLESIYQDFRDRDVLFVGVAVKDTEADALAFMEQYGISYPNTIDHDNLIERLYNVYGVPVTFIVSKEGEMLKFFFSQPSEEDLRLALEDALG